MQPLETWKKVVGVAVIGSLAGIAINEPLSRRIKRNVIGSPKLTAFCVTSITLKTKKKKEREDILFLNDNLHIDNKR